jgi:hypothetical protein
MNPKCILSALFIALLTASAGYASESRNPAQENRPEEMIVPDTNYPVWIRQRLVIPKGSVIRGTITDVVRPGRIRGKGRIAIRFDDILLPNGVKRDLVAAFRGIHGPGDEKLDRSSETVSAGSSGGADVETVVGMSGQGAIIGVIAGRGSGAAIGAGAGAAAGIVTMLFTRGRDLVLNPGTQFDLELKQPLKFAFNELEFSNAQLENARREIPRNQPVAPQRRSVLGLPGPMGMPMRFPRF